MSENTETPKRGRGRPTVLNEDQVGTATFQLWYQHGYANVSWSDIAQATGVSVRTLTRRFESKSAIAWVGTVAATTALDKALYESHPDTDINEAIVEAIVKSIESSEKLSSSGRLWLSAVANEPDLVSTAASAYAPWIDRLVAFINERLPQLPQFQAIAIASAIQAATFSVMVSELATAKSWSPSAAVRDALQHIRIVP